MTAVLAPGIPLTSPASSAANAPPGGPPATAGPPDAFATLLAAVQAAMQPDGGPPVPPPEDGAATPLDLDALLALLADVTATQEGDATTGPAAPDIEQPLLDRPAGVEASPAGTEPGTALEALMAALLLIRPQATPAVEHALPGDDVTLPVTAVTAPEAPEVTTAAGDEGDPIAIVRSVEATPTFAVVQSSVTAEAETGTPAAFVPVTSDEPVEVATLPEVEGSTTVEPELPEPLVATRSASDGPLATATADAATAVELTAAPAPTTAQAPAANDGRGAIGIAAPGTPEAVTPTAEPAVRTVPAADPAPEIAEVVRGAVIEGDTEVRLRLDPPELGTLDIRIERQDGAVRIRVEASQSAARELIERALPALQQALEARDVRVDRLEVRGVAAGDVADRSMTEQGGQFGRGSQPQQDGAPEWSSVAAMDGGGPTQRTDGRADAGRLDVMA